LFLTGGGKKECLEVVVTGEITRVEELMARLSYLGGVPNGLFQISLSSTTADIFLLAEVVSRKMVA